MAGNPWYQAGWDEYRRRSTLQGNFVRYLQANQGKLGLAEVTSCVSLGAGAGEIDSAMIRMAMPKLERYHALEPDPVLYQTLRNTLQPLVSAKKLDVKYYQTGAEEWTGPDHGDEVDVICMFSMLYFIKDIQSLLQKCQSWLKPRGRVFITVSDSQSCAARLQQKLNPGRYMDAFTKVKDILNQVGYKEVLYDDFKADTDLFNVGPELISSFLLREASQEDVEMFRSFVAENYGKNKYKDEFQVHVYMAQK